MRGRRLPARGLAVPAAFAQGCLRSRGALGGLRGSESDGEGGGEEREGGGEE